MTGSALIVIQSMSRSGVGGHQGSGTMLGAVIFFLLFAVVLFALWVYIGAKRGW